MPSSSHYHEDDDELKSELIQTIAFPKNINYLTEKLPSPNYNTHKKAGNHKSYRNISKSNVNKKEQVSRNKSNMSDLESESLNEQILLKNKLNKKSIDRTKDSKENQVLPDITNKNKNQIKLIKNVPPLLNIEELYKVYSPYLPKNMSNKILYDNNPLIKDRSVRNMKSNLNGSLSYGKDSSSSRIIPNKKLSPIKYKI